jgi:UDP-N-acetylglucosamine 4,6-dehydratase
MPRIARAPRGSDVGARVKSVLITGGTGTAGRAFVRHFLGDSTVTRIVVYSRDEHKQESLAQELAGHIRFDQLRFLLGDVRDESRLRMAMRGIDTVIHCAALKIVPKCEIDPIECVRTNIYGAENVIIASIAACVRKVMLISTDKSKDPTTLYGATKLVAERLFIAANHLSGATGNPNATRFSVCKYGNVAFSRGSVVPLFKKLAAEGQRLPITHPEMTRFWITIEDAIQFVIRSLDNMQGGEIFIPRMPSFRIMDLADAIEREHTHIVGTHIVGMRPSEKIHETLITPHDTPLLSSFPDHFIIHPNWKPAPFPLSDFTYSSDANTEWLSVDDLRRMVK